ncbi:tyrosine-type recombinase/integrase [Sphaerotilus natans]|uniref:tyrosine-type recombinase/integrase n=1 Tax=Sphaerotilus natans TaxID=34103 RepID=UPI00406C202A
MGRTAKLNQLTEAQVRAYSGKAGTPAPLHDGGGLYLRKRESGAYWYLRMKDPVTGAEQWHRMFPDDPTGGYPAKSLKDARTEARRLWAIRAQGIDPRAERERLAQEQAEARQAAELERLRRVTVRDLFERWRDLELKARTLPSGERTGRKDSGALALAQFERHVFNHIGDMTAKDVTRADVLRVIDAQLTEGKQRTAQMLFADLRQMFAFGLDRELIAADPMATLKKARIVGTGTERDRILSADEVRRLADALPRANMSPRSVCAVWLVLATGCRIGELMGATWADAGTDRAVLQAVADVEGVKLGFVDLPARTWHLPDTKSGREHTIHLSAFAVRQFERLHELRQSCAWVFPSTAGTGPVCTKSFNKQLSDRQRTDDERMSRRSKAVDALTLPGGRWTPHDLRRTTASIMAAMGISGDVIDECLNHQIESRVRRTYIRDRREADQARAFDALGERLAELAERVAPASNVARLRAA